MDYYDLYCATKQVPNYHQLHMSNRDRTYIWQTMNILFDLYELFIFFLLLWRYSKIFCMFCWTYFCLLILFFSQRILKDCKQTASNNVYDNYLWMRNTEKKMVVNLWNFCWNLPMTNEYWNNLKNITLEKGTVGWLILFKICCNFISSMDSPWVFAKF